MRGLDFFKNVLPEGPALARMAALAGNAGQPMRAELPALQDCLRASGAIPVDARQPRD